MKSYSVIFLFVLLPMTQMSCAAIQESMERAERERKELEDRSQEEYRRTYCHYDGAFKLGVNDGKNRKDMRVNVSDLCDEANKASVERGYREGYQLGLREAPEEIRIKDRRPSGWREPRGVQPAMPLPSGD